MDITHFIYLFVSWLAFLFFHSLEYCYKYSCTSDCVDMYLGYKLSRFAVSCGNSMVKCFYVTLCLIATLFSEWLYHCTFLPEVNEASDFFTSFSTLAIIYLFDFAILMGAKWYHLVILIYISLISNDVEHLFMHLLAICISFSENCLFKSFAHF